MVLVPCRFVGALLKRDLLRGWIPVRGLDDGFRAAARRVLVLVGFRPSFGRPGAFWSCAKGTKTRWGRGWAAPPAAGFPVDRHREPGETGSLSNPRLLLRNHRSGPCSLPFVGP
ncbi:MAG: hypothetical protein D6761_09110 [Candidatus Dadabacteria bacterium]|nr:MAG: hypothetical protein D6761_09110 [Candidatus Dadabacteria bacterium]